MKMQNPRERIKKWYLGLEEGSLKHILVMLGAVVVLIAIGATFNLPFFPVFLAIPIALVNPRVRARLQASRPKDSFSRINGRLRTRSVMSHPRFAVAVTTGLANLGKRLWAPQWIIGAADFTQEGVRWDPMEGHLNFGFNAITIPWGEIRRVKLRRHWLHGPADWGYLRIIGTFGPPVDIYIDQFQNSRQYFDARGIPVS